MQLWHPPCSTRTLTRLDTQGTGRRFSTTREKKRRLACYILLYWYQYHHPSQHPLPSIPHTMPRPLSLVPFCPRVPSRWTDQSWSVFGDEFWSMSCSRGTVGGENTGPRCWWCWCGPVSDTPRTHTSHSGSECHSVFVFDTPVRCWNDSGIRTPNNNPRQVSHGSSNFVSSSLGGGNYRCDQCLPMCHPGLGT